MDVALWGVPPAGRGGWLGRCFRYADASAADSTQALQALGRALCPSCARDARRVGNMARTQRRERVQSWLSLLRQVSPFLCKAAVATVKDGSMRIKRLIASRVIHVRTSRCSNCDAKLRCPAEGTSWFSRLERTHDQGQSQLLSTQSRAQVLDF